MQIGSVSRPKPGERECGDQFVVIENCDKMVVAVVDGLGHGPKAAVAAIAACDFVKENAFVGLEKLISDCSRAISSTRGVALTLLRIDTENHELTYAGIGNVEMHSISKLGVRPVNLPGIVGGRIRRIQEMSYTLSPGDVLAIFTDGISNRFSLEKYSKLEAQAMAEAIFEEHAKDHDDATCVTIRY